MSMLYHCKLTTITLFVLSSAFFIEASAQTQKDEPVTEIISQTQRLEVLEAQTLNQERLNNELKSQMLQLKSEIQTSEIYNISLEQQLKYLDRTLQKNKATIKQQKQEIAAANKQKKTLKYQAQESNKELIRQKTLLSETLDKLDSSNQRLQEQNALLATHESLLLTRQQELNNISQLILQKEEEVLNLGTTISTQQQELTTQKNSIAELDKLVSTQERALAYLWLLISFALMFVVTLIIGYRTKKQDNEKLSKRSEELQIATDKLEQQKQKAEAANQAKSQFLSLMSHELRTPMQAIIGYTDIIIEELKMEGHDSHIHDLEKVSANGERLLNIINNTLNLAKFEAGKMDIKLSTINLKTLLNEAIDNVKPQIEKNNNKLVIDINDKTHSIYADYEKLLHILINLLSNAAKFTQDGTINLIAKAKPTQLDFVVKDTGPGLTKNQQTTVFKQFYQGDHIKSGTGLGLTICHQFCELMGGTISVKSKTGLGAAFIVTIPITDRQQKPAPQLAHAS